MHIMTKESVVSWYISTSGFTHACIKIAQCSVQTHEYLHFSISRRNIAWFSSLHTKDDGPHNVKSHDVERREGVWYFLQRYFSQHRKLNSHVTAHRVQMEQSRRVPLDNKESIEEY